MSTCICRGFSSDPNCPMTHRAGDDVSILPLIGEPLGCPCDHTGCPYDKPCPDHPERERTTT